MGKYITSFVFQTLLVSSTLFAQNTLQNIALDACDCAQEEDLPRLEEKERDVKLSYCMMKSVQKFKTEPELAAFNLSDQEVMKGIARQISVEMAKVCPALMIETVRQKSTPQSSNYTFAPPSSPSPVSFGRPATKGKSFQGIFFGLEEDDYAEILVRDEKGRYQKLLWLEAFEGSELLVRNPETLKGKKVRITYSEKEAYIPKIKGYAPKKIILKLEVL